MMMSRQIPVFWFAALLVLWIVVSSINYFQGGEHIRRMDAFMSAGGRFTGEQGKVHEARLDRIESNEKVVEQRLADLEIQLLLLKKELDDGL